MHRICLFEVVLWRKGRFFPHNTVAIRYDDDHYIALSGTHLTLLKAAEIREKITCSEHREIPYEVFVTGKLWLTRCLEDKVTFYDQRDFLKTYVEILTTGKSYYHTR